jgi:hypothetical protein
MSEQPPDVEQAHAYQCPHCGREVPRLDMTTLAELMEDSMNHRPPRTGALAEWALFLLCVLVLGVIMVAILTWVIG